MLPLDPVKPNSIARSRSLDDIPGSSQSMASPMQRRSSHGSLGWQTRPKFTLNWPQPPGGAPSASAAALPSPSFSASSGRVPSLYAAALRTVTHMDAQTLEAAIRWAPPSEGSESPEYRAHVIDTLLQRDDPLAGDALLGALRQFGSDPRELAYLLTQQGDGARLLRLAAVLPQNMMQPILRDVWLNAKESALSMIRAVPSLVTHFPAEAFDRALLQPTLDRCWASRFDQRVVEFKTLMQAVPSRALLVAAKAGSMAAWQAYFSTSNGPSSLTEWKIVLDRAPNRAVRDGLTAHPHVIDMTGLLAISHTRDLDALVTACKVAPAAVLDQRDAQGERFADHLLRQTAASRQHMRLHQHMRMTREFVDREVNRDMALFVLRDRGFGPVVATTTHAPFGHAGDGAGADPRTATLVLDSDPTSMDR